MLAMADKRNEASEAGTAEAGTAEAGPSEQTDKARAQDAGPNRMGSPMKTSLSNAMNSLLIRTVPGADQPPTRLGRVSDLGNMTMAEYNAMKRLRYVDAMTMREYNSMARIKYGDWKLQQTADYARGPVKMANQPHDEGVAERRPLRDMMELRQLNRSDRQSHGRKRKHGHSEGKRRRFRTCYICF
jgi:hypothetical protein